MEQNRTKWNKNGICPGRRVVDAGSLLEWKARNVPLLRAFKNTASPALGHANGTAPPLCVSSIFMIGRAPFATHAARTINTVFDQPRLARCTSPHTNSRPDIGAQNGTGAENGTGPNLCTCESGKRDAERKRGRVQIYAHACPFSFYAAMWTAPRMTGAAKGLIESRLERFGAEVL